MSPTGSTPPDMERNIGPYELLERIGTGGMAEVYLAHHEGPEGLARRVALKRIVPGFARNPEIRAMFIDEARLLARLSHPYIVQIHDLHAADDLWLVTEYIKGPDLRTLIQHAPQGLPVELALRIGLDVAEALAYAHGRRDDAGRLLGIVHRDLKPSNVMVRQDGVVKLLDFGVAKADAKLHQTQVGAIKGSLGYFAPEQITNPGHIDLRADIYAFGVVLYEALTGHHPFEPLDGPPVVMRMLAGRFTPARKRRAQIPPAIEALIDRCITVDPGQRPARMEEIAEVLARALTRPLTFARLGAMVRESVPSSTMRVALPRFMDDDDPSISDRLPGADASGSVPGVIPLDSLEITDEADVRGLLASIDRPQDPEPADPPGFDSIDVDAADPTTQMAAPTPTFRVQAPVVARPTAPDPRPLVEIEEDGETAVVGDDEMPTFVAETGRRASAVSAHDEPTMTIDRTQPVPLQVREPTRAPQLVALTLIGLLVGLVVAIAVVWMTG